jgi:hypothetical protein
LPEVAIEGDEPMARAVCISIDSRPGRPRREAAVEVDTLFAAVATLILFAATSFRFGADSREGFVSKERELASRGFVWKASAARDRFLAREIRDARALRQIAT